MRYLFTFMLLLVVSLVEASPAPDWVLGRGHPSYDPIQYLMGVGYSKENTVSASESARAELIKSISVKVNSTIKDYYSTDKSFSEASISSESDFLLEGSQVKDGWYDEEKEIFYSLVVIKRKYVLDTLSEMINNIIAKNSLTLRQADTFYSNGHILKALVYYYDGYVESSKLLPYIQTYKSVTIEKDDNITGSHYNLLFKEKIQNIIDNINLVKISDSINDDFVSLNVKVTHKGIGINNFPIKFYSVYKHHIERVLCKSDGCETKTSVKDVLNKNNHIFIKAVPDIKTFEKYFTYNLSKHLFNRISMLNVSFKDIFKKEEVIVQKPQQNNSPFAQVETEVNRMRSRNLYGKGCEVGCFAPPLRPVYDSTSRWAPIGPGRRIPNRGRGSINFNIGFGDSRNRGNLNIYKRW